MPTSDYGQGSTLKRVGCFVLLTLSLLFSLPAAAGDYSITYAFDGPEGTETGSTECEFQSYCKIKFENAGVSLWLEFQDIHHTRLHIAAHALRRANCCFFSDGVDSVDRDIRMSSLIRLHVFEGHRRRGNEFIQNAPIGVLYLKISDIK